MHSLHFGKSEIFIWNLYTGSLEENIVYKHVLLYRCADIIQNTILYSVYYTVY